VTNVQLRLYTIEPGRLDDFLAEWAGGIRPLRERLGFVVSAWVDRDRGRLVWILDYRGDGTFEDADAAYHASPERKAFTPDPARLIAAQEVIWLDPLDGLTVPGGSAPSAR
jgi:hypothetical protein